jgi:hypothetical protein
MVRPRLLYLRWRLFAERLARSKAPILLGPWRSEVGFEVLYWIPFLNAFRKRYQINDNRLITIGRGGSAAWYRTAGAGDLYEHAPLEMMRTIATNQALTSGSIKQLGHEGWEQPVCQLAAKSIGLQQYHVVSPWWMYQLLAPFWEGREAVGWLDQWLLHQSHIQAPGLNPQIRKQLPEKYLAMRWYVRPTWPLKEDIVLWTRKLVESAAAHLPVVLIDSGFHADDHADVNLGPMRNVLNLKDIAPQAHTDNLAIQSAVISQAQGYVGTYGGMSQLAMRMGIPTLALYSEFGQTSPAHLYLTQALSLRTGVPFIATYPKAVDRLLPLLLEQKREMVA